MHLFIFYILKSVASLVSFKYKFTFKWNMDAAKLSSLYLKFTFQMYQFITDNKVHVLELEWKSRAANSTFTWS